MAQEHLKQVTDLAGMSLTGGDLPGPREPLPEPKATTLRLV